MKRYIVLIGILCLSGVVTLKAQQERNQGIIWSSLRGLEYTVKAGINIGGTAPVPLPREIRAIDSYVLRLCLHRGRYQEMVRREQGMGYDDRSPSGE